MQRPDDQNPIVNPRVWKWLFNQLHTGCGKWGDAPCAETICTRKHYGKPPSIKADVSFMKIRIMDAKNVIHYQIPSNSSHMLMLNLSWNEEYQATMWFSSTHSCKLWRSITPLLVNVASSFHSTWHKSQIHLQFCTHAIKRVSQKRKLLSHGCSSCTSCTWRGYNCTLREVCFIYDPMSSTWWISMYSTIHFLFILHAAIQAVVSQCKHISVLFPVIWILTLISPYCNSSIRIIKAIHEMYIYIFCISKSWHLL
jgi:hypothetical protein